MENRTLKIWNIILREKRQRLKGGRRGIPEEQWVIKIGDWIESAEQRGCPVNSEREREREKRENREYVDLTVTLGPLCVLIFSTILWWISTSFLTLSFFFISYRSINFDTQFTKDPSLNILNFILLIHIYNL